MKKAYVKPRIASKKLQVRLYSRTKSPLSSIEDLLISDVYATTYHTFIPLISSDRRLKRNVEPVSGALSLLNKIQGYRYSFIGNSDKAQKIKMGVLAQEIQRVCPELVSKIPNTPYLGVSYTGITALLLEAVKELSEENKSIKKTLRRVERERKG